MPVNRNLEDKMLNRYNEIVRPEIIKDRLLALRKAYNLTLDEMSSITENLMTRATLNSWETGIRVPAIDGLQIISTCFGTSIDWICGMSEVPYTEESIRIAKLFFLGGSIKDTLTIKLSEPVAVNNGKTVGVNWSKPISTDRIHLSDYPLEVQANIIVLLRYKIIFDIKETFLKKAKIIKYREIHQNIQRAINQKQPVCRIPKSVSVLVDYY